MARSETKVCEALLLDGRGGARPVSVDEINDWQPGDGILWIDLNLSNKVARRWLRENRLLDSAATEILLAVETRPRSLPHDDGMIVVMRGINMNPGAVPDDMVAVRMWLRNDLIVTLSIVAAIFLPLSFVTGLLGMNVAGLPGTEDPDGFLISALVMIGLGIGLVAFFRWKKWI